MRKMFESLCSQACACRQFFLVFLAPLRKHTSQKLLILLLWLSYQIADYVAILALGHLLRKQREACDDHADNSTELMAFWAPFLLLHLGSPGTFTSYSIEDNDLWWRHLLAFAVQVTVAFLVLLELAAVPALRIPAAIIFIAGSIKYLERIWALRCASKDQLQKSVTDPGLGYSLLMEQYFESRLTGEYPGFIRNEPPLLPQSPSNTNPQGNVYDIDQILKASRFFKMFKPLLVDLTLNFSEWSDSRRYFERSGVSHTFKIVEIELSFLYDVFHTKAVFIHGLRGCLWRFISLGIIFAAFLLFLKSEKRGYAKVDIIISHVLMGSAVFMEVISLFLFIFSDWMIVMLEKYSLRENLTVLFARVLSYLFPRDKSRWSNSMAQYSLLSYSQGDKRTILRRILRVARVINFWDNFIFIQSICVPSKLKELLFEELKKKWQGTQPSDFRILRDSKGFEILEEEGCVHLRWSTDVDFDKRILPWHIATDLCFHSGGGTNGNSETFHDGRNNNNNNNQSDREISLTTSNYMVYLLIMQPSMLSARTGTRRYLATLAEAKIFFQRVGTREITKEEASEALLAAIEDVDPRKLLISHTSQSVLFNACQLAKELNMLEASKRWRLVSRIWVEMLCYAAINCNAYNHARQLNQGGELLTHVWLLMAHMGIGDQYSFEDEYEDEFPFEDELPTHVSPGTDHNGNSR